MFDSLHAAGSGAAKHYDPHPSPDRRTFADRVFAVVARIPYGRVTTYGAIARALDAPRAAREVGWALSVAPDGAGLPCHRVVDRQGFLSGGWHWGHPDIMAGLLLDEGVPFLEPHRVDLAVCLWDPVSDDDLTPD
jgi:methylated-DNA-protein-cysteine methyltransferase-like protein